MPLSCPLCSTKYACRRRPVNAPRSCTCLGLGSPSPCFVLCLIPALKSQPALLPGQMLGGDLGGAGVRIAVLPPSISPSLFITLFPPRSRARALDVFRIAASPFISLVSCSRRAN